jgi:hypothetical protein
VQDEWRKKKANQDVDPKGKPTGPNILDDLYLFDLTHISAREAIPRQYLRILELFYHHRSNFGALGCKENHSATYTRAASVRFLFGYTVDRVGLRA